MQLITYFVLPMMLGELIISSLQVYSFPNLWNIVVLLLVVSVWGTTFFLSVPCHHQLLKQKDKTIIHRLIFTNWYRTIGWSLVFLIEIFRWF